MPTKPKTYGQVMKDLSPQPDTTDRDRLSAAKRGYGRAWRALRKYFLNHHPFCEECLDRGRHEATAEVHHIVPKAQGGRDTEDNLQGLCKSCHSRKSPGNRR